MASLDNFNTGNSTHASYPGTKERNRYIQKALHSSVSSAWDIPSTVPIAPIQPVDPAMRASEGRLNPQIEERVGVRNNEHLYVPVQPFTTRMMGDTADGIHLFQHGSKVKDRLMQLFGRFIAPVKTYTRFHPYVRR